MGYTHNFEDAEELIQDIYVKAWEKLDLIDRKTSAKGWIITIARNRCIDHFRKTKIRNLFLSKKGHEGHSTIDENTPEEIIIFESDKSKLKKCVWSLPEKLRSVFILKEYSGNSCEEISELLQVKLGTVHSRLNRGIGLISAAISEELINLHIYLDTKENRKALINKLSQVPPPPPPSKKKKK